MADQIKEFYNGSGLCNVDVISNNATTRSIIKNISITNPTLSALTASILVDGKEIYRNVSVAASSTVKLENENMVVMPSSTMSISRLGTFNNYTVNDSTTIVPSINVEFSNSYHPFMYKASNGSIFILYGNITNTDAMFAVFKEDGTVLQQGTSCTGSIPYVSTNIANLIGHYVRACETANNIYFMYTSTGGYPYIVGINKTTFAITKAPTQLTAYNNHGAAGAFSIYPSYNNTSVVCIYSTALNTLSYSAFTDSTGVLAASSVLSPYRYAGVRLSNGTTVTAVNSNSTTIYLYTNALNESPTSGVIAKTITYTSDTNYTVLSAPFTIIPYEGYFIVALLQAAPSVYMWVFNNNFDLLSSPTYATVAHADYFGTNSMIINNNILWNNPYGTFNGAITSGTITPNTTYATSSVGNRMVIGNKFLTTNDLGATASIIAKKVYSDLNIKIDGVEVTV